MHGRQLPESVSLPVTQKSGCTVDSMSAGILLVPVNGFLIALCIPRGR